MACILATVIAYCLYPIAYCYSGGPYHSQRIFDMQDLVSHVSGGNWSLKQRLHLPPSTPTLSVSQRSVDCPKASKNSNRQHTILII